jgi:hypothetical protein
LTGVTVIEVREDEDIEVELGDPAPPPPPPALHAAKNTIEINNNDDVMINWRNPGKALGKRLTWFPSLGLFMLV